MTHVLPPLPHYHHTPCAPIAVWLWSLCTQQTLLCTQTLLSSLIITPHSLVITYKPASHIIICGWIRDFSQTYSGGIHFSSHWNSYPSSKNSQTNSTSNALEKWGCGTWSGIAWFQLEWDQATAQKQIAITELIPIVIAVTIWGNTNGQVTMYYLAVTTRPWLQSWTAATVMTVS